VIVIHLFTRRLYGPWTGLLAAFFLAVSKWHLVFSRSSLRTILTPLLLIAVIHCLWLGLAEGKRRHFIWAGIWLGLGAYSYLAFRLAPVLILLFILILLWRDRPLFIKNWKNLVLMIIVAGIVFSPLAVDYIKNPFHFGGRTGQISLFQDGLGPGIIEVTKNTGRVLAMFNIPGLGDHEPKHNFPGDPAMGLIESLLFLAGLIIILRTWRDRRSQLLLLWLPLFMLPSILSFGAPNTLRTTALLPALAIITAYGLTSGINFIKNKDLPERKTRMFLVISLTLLLTTTALINFNRVFIKWGTSPEVWEKFNSTFSVIAGYVKENPKTEYLLPDVLKVHPTFEFITYSAERKADPYHFSEYSLSKLPIKPPAPGTEIICLLPQDVQFVQRYYPVELAKEFKNPFNENTRAVSFRIKK
jgi:4-amino-4-deoxy-L-arabinose transferase-like glycosyltransferase